MKSCSNSYRPTMRRNPVFEKKMAEVKQAFLFNGVLLLMLFLTGLIEGL